MAGSMDHAHWNTSQKELHVRCYQYKQVIMSGKIHSSSLLERRTVYLLLVSYAIAILGEPVMFLCILLKL
ncbi:hypothetical protein FRX31_008759 [Thalictrum thalictroides]|uniref:Uncharacterized protein n=1 Tax=Thalictrum thalictroides TaxID=46969 RepID=A0A7J6WW45_THATH|nr:hypothetical protein FRX31_008759 [Thalictrum thalictroides]